MDFSNRKASAPPVLNVSPSQQPSKTVKNQENNGPSKAFVQPPSGASTRSSENMARYQERVKSLSAKADKLISAHHKAQIVNGSKTGRSISLGTAPFNNGYVTNKERTPTIVEIPPSPVVKRAAEKSMEDPLCVDTGSELSSFKISPLKSSL